MCQTLLVVGIEPPDFVTADGRYMLQMDFVEKAIASLTQKREASPTT